MILELCFNYEDTYSLWYVKALGNDVISEGGGYECRSQQGRVPEERGYERERSQKCS